MRGEFPALEHHRLAARHYEEAARHRKSREYETAAQHVCIGHEHLLQARLLVLRERQKAVVKLIGPPSAA